MSDSVRPQRQQPTRLPRPWDSPGKNTGVGCHFLLQCIKVKVKSLSCVRLFATPWTAAYQAPPSMGFSRQEYWSGVPLPSPHYHLDSAYSKFCISNNDLLLEPQMYVYPLSSWIDPWGIFQALHIQNIQNEAESSFCILTPN